MARIQKKKTISKKKKKTDGQEPQESAVVRRESDNLKSNAAADAAAADREKRKRPSSMLRQSAGSEQTAVMRLVEKYFGTWIQFLREVRVELSKVAWPSRKQTMGSTAVVIVFVFIIAIFLGLVDILLSSLVRLIL